MISVDEAREAVLERARLTPIVERALPEVQRHSYLAERVVADRNLPPFDRSMMDGYCFAAADWHLGVRTFAVMGTIAAGAPSPAPLQSGQAYLIMTGAALPLGADSVVRREDCTEEVDQLGEKVVQVVEGIEFLEGMFVAKQGEDAQQDQELVAAGAELSPAVAAICAGVGKTRLRVHQKPSVSVLSTGDEIMPADTAEILPHQIRDSNSHALQACAALLGIRAQSLGIASDSEAGLHQQIERGLQADVFILSGGVSMGDFDLVPRMLQEAGVQQVFHKVRLKPGKPFWFGVSDKGCAVFGFPGNPVSAQVNFLLFAKPYLLKVMGSTAPQPTTLSLPLAQDWRNPFPLELYTPAHLVLVDGQQRIEPLPIKSSGDFAGLSRSTGILRCPEEIDSFTRGTVMQYLPWHT